MNPYLFKLQPYPFEKLAALKAGLTPPKDKSAITLSIGEPQHSAPGVVTEELIAHLHGLSNYPHTRGSLVLRESIARWLTQRFALAAGGVDPDRHILPVNGTREALFSFAQAVIDHSTRPLVVMPNPFYQIYEGAALLAGAEPWYLNTMPDTGFVPDFDAVPVAVWERAQLVYVCSPGNPSGAVISAQMSSRISRVPTMRRLSNGKYSSSSRIWFSGGVIPVLLAIDTGSGSSSTNGAKGSRSFDER